MAQIVSLIILFMVLASSAFSQSISPKTESLVAKSASKAWTKWPFFQQIPFWRGDQKIEIKAIENRTIVVSVQSHQKGTKTQQLELKGYGHIKVPTGRVFAYAKKLDELQELSDFIVKTLWRPSTGDFYMHSKAYKYHAKMWMSVHFEELKGQKTIWFKIDRGVFQGMAGKLNFVKAPKGTSFIEFLAQYEYKELKIPKFFIEFGLEVVLEKLAKRLRSRYEAQYKKGL